MIQNTIQWKIFLLSCISAMYELRVRVAEQPCALFSKKCCYRYKIIELLRLEKPLRSPATKIAPPPCAPLNHVLKCHTHVFWTPPGMVTTLLPWAACSNASQHFPQKAFFLISNLNLPLHNLKPFPLILLLVMM